MRWARTMDALPRRCCNQPGTDLGLVLKFMKMLDEFQTYRLKNIRSVRWDEVELYGYGVDQTPVANDQRFPGFGVTRQAQVRSVQDLQETCTWWRSLSEASWTSRMNGCQNPTSSSTDSPAAPTIARMFSDVSDILPEFLEGVISENRGKHQQETCQ